MRTTAKSFSLTRVVSAACVSLVLVAASAVPAHADHGRNSPKFAPPGAFYLSLGDSTAFGLQFDRLYEMIDAGTYTPDAFNTGFTDVLAARMHRLRAEQQTVNLSCGGESTDTMVNGGCTFTAPEPEGFGLSLHTDYSGSQLDAAVAFLHAHPNQVSPVTVSIGVIDAADVFAEDCNFDLACIKGSGLRENLGRGLDQILGALRAAAPDTEIVLVAFYSPFAISNPETNELWRRSYTRAERDAAHRNGAFFVDASEVVHGDGLCQLTFMCGSGDGHPNDAGYQRIGDQIFREAGYERIRSSREEHFGQTRGCEAA